MPTTYAIPDGRVAMAATTYTGNGTTQSISNAVNGISFQPDFIWVKSRSNADFHNVFDSVRGGIARLVTNSTNAESSTGNGFAGITSTGFNLDGSGGGGDNNVSGRTYVGWQWKAGGTAVSNTAGSITSSVSANPTAGFSVVTYTGTGTNGATFGHGLGVAPSMVIGRCRSTTEDWPVYHVSLSAGNNLRLNSTSAQFTYSSTTSGGIASTSSTIVTTGQGATTNGAMNASGATYVAYCFAPVAGYSAMGSYTGNGSADGPFIYTGFRPRYFMFKRSDGGGGDWVILDSSRSPYNQGAAYLYANASNAEATNAYQFDFLSNGIKMRDAANLPSGATYIYMAFAENPFKYANAR